MKILAITPFPPIMSGGSKASYYILKKISRVSNVRVLTYSSSDLNKGNLDVKSLHLPTKESILRGILFITMGTLLSLFHTLRFHPDLIYCKNLSSPGIIGFITSFITRKPLVLHTSGPDVARLDLRASQLGSYSSVYYRIMSFLRKKQMKIAVLVIANCHADKIAVERSWNVKKVTTIYNGVNHNKFRQANTVTKKRIRNELNLTDGAVIGFTGRVDSQKNPEILLKIASVLKNHNFIFVGPNSDEMSIYGKIPKNLMCTGGISNVNYYLNAMDIFILPSKAEGLSNSLIEAMASGLCCICFPVGEAPLLIKDGFNGVLVNSYEEMLNKIFELTINIRVMKTIGRNAHKTALKLFSWDKSANRIYDCFKLIYKKNL